MVRVSASQFAKNFGRYKEIAQREPVEITSHERTSGYLISEAEFKLFLGLRAKAGQAYYVEELPAEVIEDLVNARMDPRHDDLNSLLADAPPHGASGS